MMADLNFSIHAAYVGGKMQPWHMNNYPAQY